MENNFSTHGSRWFWNRRCLGWCTLRKFFENSSLSHLHQQSPQRHPWMLMIQTYLWSKAFSQLNKAIDDDIKHLDEWLQGNKLYLSVTKTWLMLICTKPNVCNSEILGWKAINHLISEESSIVVFKSPNSLAPQYLCSRFDRNSSSNFHGLWNTAAD